MRYYRLLRDMFNFKAGEEFYFNDKGDLVSIENRKIAYSAEILDEFPNILLDWFDSADTGFYLDERGRIVEYAYDENSHYLDYRKNIGNDFENEKEAKKYKEYLKALQVIKNDTKGFVPDWKDVSQGKYKGLYDHTHKKFDLISVNTSQSLGTIYFKNKEDIRESLKKHRKEWLTVLGVENENN